MQGSQKVALPISGGTSGGQRKGCVSPQERTREGSFLISKCTKLLELFQYLHWAKEIDEGRIPEGMQAILEEVGALKREK